MLFSDKLNLSYSSRSLCIFIYCTFHSCCFRDDSFEKKFNNTTFGLDKFFASWGIKRYCIHFFLSCLFKVVTEYERAVIFRLGRLRKGGSKGPGIFTVIPCIDTYRCVDLRTVSFDVPPQEASIISISNIFAS